MRKCSGAFRRGVPVELLQCGRIYKDAEIGYLVRHGVPGIAYLQCGRIYKDAEIRLFGGEEKKNFLPSMWPHL